ncbi:MAG: fibronectin type III domain-containing protein [Candidatus Acidiferrales bacterium]
MRTLGVLRRATGWQVARGVLPFAIVVALLGMAGCASPGEPVERRSPIPTAITDLSAEQSGNSVVLTCTIPRQTVDQKPLEDPPTFEIYRAIHPTTDGSFTGIGARLALLVTIPSAMVATYTTGDHFRYVDSLTAGDFLPNHQQSVADYVIRTQVSPKKESAESDRVALPIYPAPLPISDLSVRATQSVIVLSWSAPQAILTGDVPQIKDYHIYRANAQTPATAAGVGDLLAPSAVSAVNQGAAAAAGEPASASTRRPQLTSPLVQIGESPTTEYRDGDAQEDRTYVYAVRSVTQTPGKPLESGDSNLVATTLHDVFPPSAPTGLIATPVPAEDSLGAHMDLSWAINPETDLTGYNVYRSEKAGVSGTRLNPQLLPTPAFRDMNAVLGQSYYYTVTAVDRTGNESAPSAAVQAGLPTAAGSPAGNQATP